jgi:hypothetical protein
MFGEIRPDFEVVKEGWILHLSLTFTLDLSTNMFYTGSELNKGRW